MDLISRKVKKPRGSEALMPVMKMYACRTCGKAYTIKQALGGHVAGHRRRDKKRLKEEKQAAIPLKLQPLAVRCRICSEELHKQSSCERPFDLNIALTED